MCLLFNVVNTYETAFKEFDNVSMAFIFLHSNLVKLLQNEDFYDISRSCIEQIKTPNGVQLSPECVKSIKMSRNFNELLSVLSLTPYWSWIDLRLIMTIVAASQNHNAMNLIRGYQNVVFTKRLKEVLPDGTDKKRKEAYCTKLALLLNKDPNDMTVADLLEHQSLLEPVIMDISKRIYIVEHLDQLSIPEDLLKDGIYVKYISINVLILNQ